jgi:redox-sensing transcriptional repressor
VDIDPEKFGRHSRSGVPVLPYDQMPQIVRRNDVEIGILAVATESAQDAYDALVDTGVRAILNFAPVQMRYQRGVKVRSVDLRINLESLSFYLKNVEDGTAVE